MNISNIGEVLGLVNHSKLLSCLFKTVNIILLLLLFSISAYSANQCDQAFIAINLTPSEKSFAALYHIETGIKPFKKNIKLEDEKGSQMKDAGSALENANVVGNIVLSMLRFGWSPLDVLNQNAIVIVDNFSTNISTVYYGKVEHIEVSKEGVSTTWGYIESYNVRITSIDGKQSENITVSDGAVFQLYENI